MHKQCSSFILSMYSCIPVAKCLKSVQQQKELYLPAVEMWDKIALCHLHILVTSLE